MKQRLHLLFDLDDTLIHCNKYFDIVIDQFADELVAWFAPYRLQKDEIKQKQQELDLAGIDVNGFAAERFPDSFVETYEYFSALYGREADPHELDRLLKIGYSVYNSQFELYPDVVETLTGLERQGHKLSLYTGGDEKIQRKKVEKVNLSPFFGDRIFVARHKNGEALKDVLQQHPHDPERTWMIGNSLRTDIVPALTNNIGAIYIPPLSNWAFDRIEIPVESTERMLTVTALPEIEQAIRQFYAKSGG